MLDDKTIKILFDFIKLSPFIQSNSKYLDTINNTEIIINESNIVNAFAYTKNNKNFIEICNGIYYLSLIAGYGFVSKDETLKEPFSIFKNMMIDASKIILNKNNLYGEFTIDNTLEILNKYIDNNISDEQIIESESFTYGCILSIIAHELGHICLHHINMDENNYTKSISINNERMADIFATNVLNSTPFARYTVISNLIVNVFLYWISDKEIENTTHPSSRERIDYIYKSSEKSLINYGISKELIESFIKI